MVRAKTHLRELMFPCREAKKYNCKRLFSNLRGVGQHLRTHPSDVEPTEDERQLDVSGWVNMRYHPATSQFYCTVPACVNAVTRQSISYRGMAKHMAAHKARGHMEDLSEELYQPERSRHHIRSTYTRTRMKMGTWHTVTGMIMVTNPTEPWTSSM